MGSLVPVNYFYDIKMWDNKLMRFDDSYNSISQSEL